jgi:hypothetical protein
MSDQKKSGTTAADAQSYPDKTAGSEAALKFRKTANKWSEEKRAAQFNKGMQIIYGGNPGKTQLCNRH